MATTKNTRTTTAGNHDRRRAGRIARPRKLSMPPKSAAAILADVRRRLKIIGAVASITCVALHAQTADADRDAADTLRYCIVDELNRQIEEIDWVHATCTALLRRPGHRRKH